MPKKIETLEQMLSSTRFKKETNNKIFTPEEKNEISKLFSYLLEQNIPITGSLYGMMTTIISHETENLVERFKFIKENPKNRTIQTYVMRYGKTEGEFRWNQYVEKQRYKNTFESKNKKYGWTKEQFDEFNKSRSVTFEKCIERHGYEKGNEVWKHYCERQSYTNSLDYYKEKYGEDIGYTKWLEYNKEKSKSKNLDWVIEKYGVTEEEALEILAKRHTRSYTSEAERCFVNMLEERLGKPIKYTIKTQQYCIWNNYLNAPNFYDVTCTSRKKIIEFHGDYWHCNPSKYDKDFVHLHAKTTAGEIWKRDLLKRQAALDKGFSFKIVWWSEFENTPDEIIKECVEWLEQ